MEPYIPYSGGFVGYSQLVDRRRIIALDEHIVGLDAQIHNLKHALTVAGLSAGLVNLIARGAAPDPIEKAGCSGVTTAEGAE